MSMLNAVTHQSRLWSAPEAVGQLHSAAIEVSLETNEVWQMAGDNRWRIIICLKGETWITQERDLRDYILTAGEMFIVTQPGLVVVQARQAACIRLMPSLKPVSYMGDFVNTVFP